MSALPPVLLLGGETAIALTVVRELGGHGVPVDVIGKTRDAIAGHSRHCRRLYLRPEERDFAAWLPGMVAQSGAKALMAISEGDLVALAALPDVIGDCRVLTPRAEPLALVLDKSRTLAAARAAGLDVPASWQPVAGEDFAARAAALTYPVILKWSDPPAIWAPLEAAGLPFRKIDYADGPQALVAALAHYDCIGQWPIVQSYCGGYGFGQMLMMASGRATLRFQHRRLREYPATGGVSTLSASVPLHQHRAQMQRSEALLAAIGWEGPAMVEYRHDPVTGRYWLMEINGRFWGSLPLASQSGVCFAWEQYRIALNLDGAPQPAYRRRRARYAIPDAKRLIALLRNPASATAPDGTPSPRRIGALLAWLADHFDPRTGYYVWSWRDPKPFFADLAAFIRKRR